VPPFARRSFFLAPIAADFTTCSQPATSALPALRQRLDSDGVRAVCSVSLGVTTMLAARSCDCTALTELNWSTIERATGQDFGRDRRQFDALFRPSGEPTGQQLIYELIYELLAGQSGLPSKYSYASDLSLASDLAEAMLPTKAGPPVVARRLYPDRTSGGDRDHRNSGGHVAAIAEQGQGQGAGHPLPEQSPATPALLDHVLSGLQ
jgi:hypothetical protein